MTAIGVVTLFVSGVLSGIINVVGGGGSILSLPALITFGGMTSQVANATNRIGILAQSLMAVWQFRRNKVTEWPLTLRLCLVGVPGAALGAWIAARISPHSFDVVLGVALMFLLVLVLRPPKSSAGSIGAPQDGSAADAWRQLTPKQRAGSLAAFFVLGIYAGFLQAGVGILITLALNLISRLELRLGTYVKLAFVLVQTVIALATFKATQIEVRWVPGAIITAGFLVGGYVGSWVALKKSEAWLRAILVGSILLTSAQLLGVFKWVAGLFRG